MTTTDWTTTELSTIGDADEIQLAPFRPDGTHRASVTIWIVRYGDNLYVRSWRGHGGAWFRAALVCHAAHIRAGGLKRDVSLVEETDLSINDQIDSAYRTKYRRYPSYVPPMVSSDARATTLKLVPRS